MAAAGFNLRVHRQVVAARRGAGGGAARPAAHGPHALDRGRAARRAGARTRPQGGGALWELGIHHLDLWRFLCGREPEAVHAAGDDDALALTARLEDGTLLATTIATGTSDANEVELVGERGRLTAGRSSAATGPRWAPRRPRGRAASASRLRAAAASAASLPRQARAARAGGDYRLSYAAEWAAVRAAVRDGTPPPADARGRPRARSRSPSRRSARCATAAPSPVA